MGRWTALAPLAALTLTCSSARAQPPAPSYDHAALEASKPAAMSHPPDDDDAFFQAGRALYLRRCAPCHGESGGGDGPAAEVMYPRPRNFTAANFGFRTTRSGELPTDADLFRTISRGVPGTAMPAWGEGDVRLSETERWQAAYYVKHLTGLFWDEYTNPHREVSEGEPQPILTVPSAPPETPELLARGRALYREPTAAGCVRCHGESGRGDGEAAREQLDDLGQPVRPADLTNPWRIKNGDTPSDYFRTLSSGISGTPMPDYMDALSDEDRWALAYYARSFVEPRTLPRGALVARQVAEAPVDPDDPAWDGCEELGVALMGQAIVAPRWQAPSVDYVRLRALYDETSIAIRVEWNDPFLDDGSAGNDTNSNNDAATGPEDGEVPTYVTVHAMTARATAGGLPDRVALHLPVGRRRPEAVERPHMLLGDPAHRIHAWQWSAEGGGTFAESIGAGAEDGYMAQEPGAVELEGAAQWEHGRWRVVFRRPLTGGDASSDAQLEPGSLVPLSIRVWDGSAGEDGLQSAMSSWQHVYLEAPIPARPYLAAAAVTLLGYLLIGTGWRRLRRPAGAKRRRRSTGPRRRATGSSA